jgi:hypothetical protein
VHAQNVEIILGSMVNMIGEPICSLNDHKNLHFDIDKGIHITSKFFEANAYRQGLDLLIISQ